VGPLVGAAIGALLYDGAVRATLKARGVPPDPEVAEQGRTAVD
jgi:hypothetical protein